MSTVPSVKKALIRDLLKSCTFDELKSNQLILVTGAGVISGYPILNDATKAESATTLISEFCKSSLEKYKADFPTEASSKDADGFIILRDTTLRMASDYVVQMGEVVIFFDEIIAVSIGTIS